MMRVFDHLSFRRPLGAGVVLAAVLVAALVLGAVPQAAHARKATADNPYKISLVVWRGCEEACRGFQDFLKSRRLPAEVTVYDAATDKTRIPGFVQDIKSKKPDLVVTWGTTTALTVFGAYDSVDPDKNITKIPGVFMIVSQPIQAKVVPNYQSSGRNITGTVYLVPENVQIKAAQSYMDFRKIGVVYTPTERNSVINVDRLREEAEKQGMTVVAKPVGLDADGKPDAATIPSLVSALADAGVDLIYQGADSFLNINRKILTGEAVKHGLPVFAAGEAPVRSGKALMGVVNQYYVVGQLTALKAEKVLQGADPETVPIEAPRRFSFLINVDVAKTLEQYPPMKLIRFAEFIR